jgi:hypothetical protein
MNHGIPWKCLRPALATLVLFPAGAVADTTGNPPHSAAPVEWAFSELVAFDNSPFPYQGEVPGQGVPFLDVVDGNRRGHTSPRGGVYWERPTYSDRRTLLYLPKGFDASRPALIVAFFHGNRSLLWRDVHDRQQVPRQLAESGLNAALVAPQFAVDALDSSAGKFWQPDKFARFLDEAAGRLAELHGDQQSRGKFAAARVVIVAYSGGYHPAAFAATLGGADDRLLGMILIDAPYADEDMFADWVATHRSNVFFATTYAAAARRNNTLLKQLLTERGVGFRSALPERLNPGTIAFFDAGNDIVHSDFLTQAWTADPLKSLLSRIPGFARTSGPAPAGRD